MKTTKTAPLPRVEKKRFGYIAKLLVIIFVLFSIGSVFRNLDSIHSIMNEIDEYRPVETEQRLRVEELQRILASPVDDDYITRRAKELGYRSSSEILFFSDYKK